MTQTGGIGTSGFMSTEVLMRLEVLMGISHKISDYYSLGVTLYNLITGNITPLDPASRQAMSVSGLPQPLGMSDKTFTLIIGLTNSDFEHRDETYDFRLANTALN